MQKLSVVIGIPHNFDAEDGLSNALQDDGLLGDLGNAIEQSVKVWVGDYMHIPYRQVEVTTRRLAGLVLVD